MNTNKTIELTIRIQNAERTQSTRKDTATVELPKPDCKNGVCALNWKPIKPPVAA